MPCFILYRMYRAIIKKQKTEKKTKKQKQTNKNNNNNRIAYVYKKTTHKFKNKEKSVSKASQANNVTKLFLFVSSISVLWWQYDSQCGNQGETEGDGLCGVSEDKERRGGGGGGD